MSDAHTYTTDEIREALCTQIRNTLAGYDRAKGEYAEYLWWFRRNFNRAIEAERLERTDKDFRAIRERMESCLKMFEVANEQLRLLPTE